MQTARILWSAIAVAALAALAATAVRAETPPAQLFEIPAGELVRALEVLSRQIPVSLIYQPDQMRGVKTDGVSGVLTPREAVLQLLRGSTLQLSTDASTGALLITLPNVRSQRTREGPSKRTVADVVAPTPSGGDISDTRQIEELVVTGSMLNSSVAAEEGAAPVRVLSLETIRRGGATTLYEALRGMPELAGYADNDSRSGARDTREINLRGLGPQYTLVLINGRRVGQNNLNLVPFAAVERIEILKDGASAVYGSDALAGVVNVILRRNYDGVEVTADYGNSTHFSDASKANISAVLGARGERGSVIVSGQFEKQTPASSSEHPLGRTDDFRRWGSRDLRFQRQNPGRIRLGNGSEVMLDPTLGDGAIGSSPTDYVPAYDNKIDKLRVNNLQNLREVGTFFGGGEYQLGEKVELFADFFYKSANIEYVDHRGVLLDLDVPASNYWNPFGQDVHVSYLLDASTPERRERGVESLTSDMRTRMLTLGLKGTIGSVAYSLAHTDWRSSDLQSHDGL
ncbi:MAG TPA: TonB-dependent receptor plug domain-containing protein, partial [Steroidobacter sp.]